MYRTNVFRCGNVRIDAVRGILVGNAGFCIWGMDLSANAQAARTSNVQRVKTKCYRRAVFAQHELEIRKKTTKTSCTRTVIKLFCKFEVLHVRKGSLTIIG